MHAVSEVAMQAHLLLDGQGSSPGLDLSAMPAPHVLGINWGDLLEQGLGVDLDNPQIAALSEQQLQQLQHLSFDRYFEKLQDPSLCGEWQHKYFSNDASWVPAPFGKFGTKQLAGLLTTDAVLASLSDGVWGRALLAAASKAGLQANQLALGFKAKAQPAGGKLKALWVEGQAGAWSVGSAPAVLFLQNKLAGSWVRLAKLVLAVAVLALLQQHC